MSDGGTHYDTLGVAPTATIDEIRQAYRRKARLYHPDLRPGSDGTMETVNLAWSVLRDPSRRRVYDETIGVATARPSRPSSTWRPLDDDDGSDEPAWSLLEDPAPPGRRPGLLVFAPVALLALAVACFALSMMSLAPNLLLLSIVLVPAAGVAFAAMPILVLRRERRLSRD